MEKYWNGECITKEISFYEIQGVPDITLFIELHFYLILYVSSIYK